MVIYIDNGLNFIFEKYNVNNYYGYLNDLLNVKHYKIFDVSIPIPTTYFY